jgi:DNA-binding NarL/FixJ family response regulator
MEPIRLLIVAGYPVIREGLRAMLSTDLTIEIVGEASDGVEAVAMVAEKKPNVVLMDIRMPNRDGIEAARRVKDKHPSVSVIVFTMYDDDAYVIDAIRAGASAYLLKDTSQELLFHTVRTAISGETLISTELLYKTLSSLVPLKSKQQRSGTYTAESLVSLTPREQDVLILVADGCTNKEIGKKLGITEDTVKKHMQSILAKLDATSRTGAIAKATRAGLVQ